MATVYYHDGSTWNGHPWDAPAFGVVCVAWDDPDRSWRGVGRVVLQEWDFYLYSGDIGWHGTSKYSDLLNHLAKRPMTLRAVLQGLWIPRERFLEIVHKAETDGQPKSARHPLLEVGD